MKTCVICGHPIPQTDGVQLTRLERRRVYVVRSFSWMAHLGCRAAMVRTLAPYLRICPWIRADNQQIQGILSLEPTPF